MEPYQNVHAVVLRARDYKEADQLLTIYTSEQGKMTVQARGVKKTTSKLRSGILLFSCTDLMLTVGKGFPIVTGASTVEAFPSLRSDFVRMSYAGYAAELLDKVLADGQPDGELFRLILQTMYLLEHIDPWLAVQHLQLQLLEQQGYGVNLHHCHSCGTLLRGEKFRVVQGGFLCPQCSAHQREGFMMHNEGLTVLQALKWVPTHRLGWVYVSRQGRGAVEQYLDIQMQQILNVPLKSKDFLKQMNL